MEHKFFTLVTTKSMSRREQEQKSLNSHLWEEGNMHDIAVRYFFE